jgi:hypothetical protein
MTATCGRRIRLLNPAVSASDAGVIISVLIMKAVCAGSGELVIGTVAFAAKKSIQLRRQISDAATT